MKRYLNIKNSFISFLWVYWGLLKLGSDRIKFPNFRNVILDTNGIFNNTMGIKCH